MIHRHLRIPVFCLFLIPALMGCDADIQNEAPPSQDRPVFPPEIQTAPGTALETPDRPVTPKPSQPTDIPDIPPQPETPDQPEINQPETPDQPEIDQPETPDQPEIDQPAPQPDEDNPLHPDTSQPLTPLAADGLNNFYRLNDDLYRSAQPTENGLTSAKTLGIQTVLSLQLVSLDNALEATEQTGLSLIHIPMFPWNVTENELLQALEVLRDAPKPILVHCLHGADRTGIVIAMYRILFQNWSKSDAIAEMTSDLFGYHEEFSNLPELIEQLDIEAMRSKLFNYYQ